MANWEFLRDVRDTDQCVEWPYAVADTGYGVVSYGGKLWQAHRLVLTLRGVGVVGQYVRHTCDNRPCVNPRHLVAGTQKANACDMANKGRRKGRCLTDAEVLEVRKRYVPRCPVNGCSAIARELGMNSGSLWRVLVGYRR